MVKQKHLTIFAIFELMDQNRDEGTGNFQTLKKVKRLDGVYTFISKYSFRHHLFNELKETACWKEAAVRQDKDVIQFDLSEDDILTSPELDAFGYMFTISGDNAITRKAAVGLTDLVSLEPYNGDSAFYANHDMVRRAVERGLNASPNPFGKEEHYSFYKGGITINTNRLGIDEWIVSEEPKENNGILNIQLKQNAVRQIEVVPQQNLPDNLNWVLEKYGKLLEDIKVYKTQDEKGYIIVGKIKKANNNDDEDKYKILFILNPEKRKKRIKELVESIRGGIKFQVGGRDYALVPILLIVALMKSPLQVFFPHIGVTVGENKKYRILGLQSALDNPKVEKVFIEYNKDRLICEYKINKEIGCLEDIYKELFGNQENFKNQEDSNNEG